MSIRRRIQLIFAAILLIVLGSALINAWGDRFVGRGIELMTTDAELLRTTFMLKVSYGRIHHHRGGASFISMAKTV